MIYKPLVKSQDLVEYTLFLVLVAVVAIVILNIGRVIMINMRFLNKFLTIFSCR